MLEVLSNVMTILLLMSIGALVTIIVVLALIMFYSDDL